MSSSRMLGRTILLVLAVSLLVSAVALANPRPLRLAVNVPPARETVTAERHDLVAVRLSPTWEHVEPYHWYADGRLLGAVAFIVMGQIAFHMMVEGAR